MIKDNAIQDNNNWKDVRTRINALVAGVDGVSTFNELENIDLINGDTHLGLAVGDILPKDKVTEKYNPLWDATSYEEIWEYSTSGGHLEAMDVDSEGNLWVEGKTDNVLKLSPEGEVLREYQHDTEIRSIHIDDEDSVYVGDTGGNLTKILKNADSPEWTYASLGYIHCIATDANHNVYFGNSHDYLTKLSSSGTLIWSKTYQDYDITSITITENDDIFFGCDSVFKIDSDGEIIWQYYHPYNPFHAIEVNTLGYIFVTTQSNYSFILNPDGTLYKTIYTVDSGVYSLAIDTNNNIYYGTSGNSVFKMSWDTIQNTTPAKGNVWEVASLTGDAKAICLTPWGCIYIGTNGEQIKKITQNEFVGYEVISL